MDNEFKDFTTTPTLTFDAVSYTHLDVYKRQLQNDQNGTHGGNNKFFP